MPSYDHDAIYKAYPDAATIDDSTGVFKADGSKITIVQSNVDAARVELNKLNYKNIQFKTVLQSEFLGSLKSGFDMSILNFREEIKLKKIKVQNFKFI